MSRAKKLIENLKGAPQPIINLSENLGDLGIIPDKPLGVVSTKKCKTCGLIMDKRNPFCPECGDNKV